MYWPLELASKLEDAPWPATKEELIDYAMRSGAPMEVVEKVKNIEGIEACSPQFYSQTISGASCCSVGVDIRVIGFDPKTDFILAPYFAQKDFDTLEDDEIVVGSNFANYAASSFIILGQQFKVAGELYPTGTGMDNTIFMNIDVARRVTAESEAMKDEWKDRDVNDFISVVMVKLKDGTDPAAFKKMLYKENLSVQCVATGSTIASFSLWSAGTAVLCWSRRLQ